MKGKCAKGDEPCQHSEPHDKNGFCRESYCQGVTAKCIDAITHFEVLEDGNIKC